MAQLGFILKNPELFNEAFEKTNKVTSGEQLPFLKVELMDILSKGYKGSPKFPDSNSNVEEEMSSEISPTESIRQKSGMQLDHLPSSNTPSIDKNSKSKKLSMISISKVPGQGEELATEAQELTQLKSMYEDTQQANPTKRKSRLQKKDTLLVENFEMQEDDLESLGLLQVNVQKKMKLALETILELALARSDLVTIQSQHLLSLFEAVGLSLISIEFRAFAHDLDEIHE